MRCTRRHVLGDDSCKIQNPHCQCSFPFVLKISSIYSICFVREYLANTFVLSYALLESISSFGVNMSHAKNMLFVGFNAILVGFIGKLINDSASRSLPEDDDINHFSKKMSSHVFWDAMFPHSMEAPLAREHGL